MSSRFIMPFADVGSGIKPSSGAKLLFFEVDGTTPKDTFSDQLSTPTANTNPVIADSNGVFGDIYIEGVNKVTLQDKNGSQIFGLAEVTELSTGDLEANLINDISQSYIFDTVALMKSSLIIFPLGKTLETVGYYSDSVQGAASYLIVDPQAFDGFGDHELDNGNIAELVKFKNEAIVTQFGAKNNDTTDDSDAINAAQESIDVRGGRLHFPGGLGYKVTKSLIIRNNQTWTGASMNGTKISIGAFVADGYQDTVIQTATQTDISRFHIHDLTIDGEGGSGAAGAIKLWHGVQCNLHDLYVRQSTGKGITISNPTIVTLDNIYVNAPQSYAFHFECDSDTGMIRFGTLIADNGPNVPAIFATQTTQSNFSLIGDVIRVEGSTVTGGWSHGALIESFTQISGNGIHFSCNAIRTFAAPHPDAVDPCVCEIHNAVKYTIGETSCNVAPLWPAKFAQYNGTRPSPLSDATYYKSDNTKGLLMSGVVETHTETALFTSLGQNTAAISSSKFVGIYTESVHDLTSEATGSFGAFQYLKCLVGGVTKAMIIGDGSFESATNSYGAISDMRLKNLVGDARDYTDDILKHKLIKYTLKDDPDGLEMLGLSAQDTLENSPGLVNTTWEYEKIINEDGSISSGEKIDGSDVLSVKYSIIYLQAISALQSTIIKQRAMLEAQERILQRLDDAGI